ncbi:MAG: VWA domain-containing protein [archaeon]|nr:VWA domain-containing protein [archaeon]MCR4323883.1 VWA domain-containing protein [Nanoarchaeota archaeon]
MEIVFRNSFYLWSLVVVPIIIIAHFLSLRYSRQRAIKFANFVALARVSEKIRMTSNFSVLFMRVFVFIAIVFAIAGTTLHYSGSQVDADYVVAIDASASMLAEDFLPNRFEAAKASAIGFVDSLPIYSSVGVISFSGTSYVNQPLTMDKTIVKSAIEGQEILVAGGTSIGDAVITSTNLLMNSNKPKVIILLTDGRSNLGISTNAAIDYASKNRVVINAIGIGTEEGYFVDIGNTDVLLGINLDELQSLADYTGGKVYSPTSETDLEAVYKEIALSEKTNASLDLTFFLLIFILFVLTLEWVLINTRYRIIP